MGKVNNSPRNDDSARIFFNEKTIVLKHTKKRQHGKSFLSSYPYNILLQASTQNFS